MSVYFRARPDDPYLVFEHPTGWVRLNQRYLETCTKRQAAKLMRALGENTKPRKQNWRTKA